MASFASDFPRAYHVFPLHAWSGITRERRLKAKPAGFSSRPTTSRVDQALGFASYVHCYLVSGAERIPELPILRAQMQTAREPPFPHGVIEFESTGLDDAECVLCNWNLAVSRPAVPGVVKGGNWARGTRPERIREIWEAFRGAAPSVHRARGYFNPGRAVPTLEGEQIAACLKLLRRAPNRIPELLLHGEVPLSRARRVIVFSESDAELLALSKVPDVRVEVEGFPGYDSAVVPPQLRRRLRQHLTNRDDDDSLDWNFDSVRVAS